MYKNPSRTSSNGRQWPKRVIKLSKCPRYECYKIQSDTIRTVAVICILLRGHEDEESEMVGNSAAPFLLLQLRHQVFLVRVGAYLTR